jgi:hypothetical protein
MYPKPVLIHLAIAVLAAMGLGRAAMAVPFTTSYTDGSSWNSIYAQGFSPSQSPVPDPELPPTDVVPLDRFQFFKSGNVDSAADIRLAVVNNFFLNLDTLTTGSSELIGLSTNTIATTASLAVGDPITFHFDSIPLVFGDDYAAIFVNVDEAGAMTPVLVSALIADYVETEPGSGVFAPESDYGDPEIDYFKSTSNFISTNEFGSFLASFNAPYADANFIASFDLEVVALHGDYNQNGSVDAADYVVWRDNLGGSLALPNESETLGMVTQEDYGVWKANFGAANADGQGLNGAAGAVPEPTSLVLVWLAASVTAALAGRTCKSN